MSEASTEAIEPLQNVYQCVSAVQGELAKKGIGKGQKNTFDNYNFRGIDDVYNALGPVLSQHGLIIFPEVTDRVVTERTSQKGGALFHVVLDVIYHFVSMYDGSEMLVPVPGEAMDRGDKAINKAMSAAYKLACFQTFCIPVDGQDSEQESHEIIGSSVSAAVASETKGEVNPGQVERILDDLENALTYDADTKKVKCVVDLEAMRGIYEEIVSDEKLMAVVWNEIGKWNKGETRGPGSATKSWLKRTARENGWE